MIIAHNLQEKNWMGEHGNKYTKNETSISDGGIWKGMEEDMKKNFGITNHDIYSLFLRQISRECKVLEVGCNRGHKLLLFQRMGFRSLYGVDINRYAVDLSKQYIKNADIIQASAFEIPFGDSYFDLVFTNGLLSFIHPSNIVEVLKEVYRCTNKYIFGVELFSRNGYTEMIRKNKQSYCWMGNFQGLYATIFYNLKLMKAITIDSLFNKEGYNNPLKVFLFKKERTTNVK